MKMIWIYFIIINIVGFLVMGLDKAKAKAGAWRIPEKTLFAIAVIGGSIGAWAGMEVFRHKTKHWYFKFGIPIIFLMQLVFYIFFFR